MRAAPLDASQAPFYAELAEGPADGAAHWLTASDGVRIRVVSWGQNAPKGTVLLFPGRTEYAEKYGRAAADLYTRGYATLTIDWRGQGLADRLISDPALGHVGDFQDYQLDVMAMVAHADAANLPKPYYLLAHSMGGAIGLRALHNGLEVEACAFTGPMWGIGLNAIMRPTAWVLSTIARRVGLGDMLAPGQKRLSYVLRQAFEGNTLTNDAEMFNWMRTHMQAHPELGLGGPTLRWLNEALHECRALAALPAPDTRSLTFLGAQEDIVNPQAVHDQMARWDNGKLEIVDPAEHEVLMDTPEVRARTFDALAELFIPA